MRIWLCQRCENRIVPDGLVRLFCETIRLYSHEIALKAMGLLRGVSVFALRIGRSRAASRLWAARHEATPPLPMALHSSKVHANSCASICGRIQESDKNRLR